MALSVLVANKLKTFATKLPRRKDIIGLNHGENLKNEFSFVNRGNG